MSENFTTPTHENWVMAHKLVNFPYTLISDVGLENFHSFCIAWLKLLEISLYFSGYIFNLQSCFALWDTIRFCNTRQENANSIRCCSRYKNSWIWKLGVILDLCYTVTAVVINRFSLPCPAISSCFFCFHFLPSHLFFVVSPLNFLYLKVVSFGKEVLTIHQGWKNWHSVATIK